MTATCHRRCYRFIIRQIEIVKTTLGSTLAYVRARAPLFRWSFCAPWMNGDAKIMPTRQHETSADRIAMISHPLVVLRSRY